MTQKNPDPSRGPGTTSDPNQANLNDLDPWLSKDDDVPQTSEGPTQTNDDPSTGPGTTSDPNQADRT